MFNNRSFPTVVVGVDGATGGRDAFCLARCLAADAERLILVSVDLSDPVGNVMAGGANRADAARQAEQLALTARADGRAAEVLATTAGTVAGGLAEQARRCRADLVVVGSSQRGPVLRVLLGDDTRDVLHQAPCVVAVAPRGYAERPPEQIATIGVGYGSDAASERALAVARQLEPPGGSLRLTHAVYPSPNSMKLLPSGVTAEALARLAALEGFDERSIVFGSVRHGLLELAQRVDLLVVGLHRDSALGRLLHGSTADTLLHDLPCPLLAVPELPLHAPVAGLAQ